MTDFIIGEEGKGGGNFGTSQSANEAKISVLSHYCLLEGPENEDSSKPPTVSLYL